MKQIAAGSALLLVVALAMLGVARQIGADGEDPPVYVADESDWICGLGDLRQLTNPARVDYERLMEATPDMKELRREGIDPESARGLILRTRAQAEVKRACNTMRLRLGHCSVWKAIHRRDGRPIPERTSKALEEIGRAPAPAGDLVGAGQSSSSAGTSW